MDKHILFTLEKYYPLCDATGNCLKNIIDQLLINNNLIIHILQFSDSELEKCIKINDKLYIHSFYYKKRKHNLIKKFLFYPGYDGKLVKAFNINKQKIINEYNIKFVFDCFYPFENLLSTINDKTLNLTPVLIMFDTFFTFNKTNNFFKKALRKFYGLSIHKFKKKIRDSYLYIMSQEEMESGFSECVDFFFKMPLVKTIKHKTNNVLDKTFLYAGSFYPHQREPWFFINKILDILNLNYFKEYKLEIYCDRYFYDQISQKYKNEKRIMVNEFIPREYLEEKMLNCSFLINVENNNSLMLPSKLIEYLSYNKPIINFSNFNQSENRYLSIIRNFKRVINIPQISNYNVQNIFSSLKEATIVEDEKKLFGNGSDIVNKIIEITKSK